MLILPIPAWLAVTNAYLVAPEPGGPALLVDAPPQPGPIVEAISDHDLAVVAVLLTHGHVDHTGGSGRMAESTGASVFVHPDDDFLTLDPVGQLRALFGMVPPGDYAPPPVLERLSDGQNLRLAGLDIEVMHTPGHTPGHCCLYLRDEETLFSGDQLFAGSIGRTDLPGGSYPALAESMRTKVMVLPDDTRVLPGHGPETTVGRERATNPFRGDWAPSAYPGGTA